MKKAPQLTGIDLGRNGEGTPEVIAVNFDIWALRVTLIFPNQESDPTYIEFHKVAGFRVLDESDLLEFGAPEPNSCLAVVENNGWLSMESARHTAPFIKEDMGVTEYYVFGIDYCVSVLAWGEPVVTRPHNNTGKE